MQDQRTAQLASLDPSLAAEDLVGECDELEGSYGGAGVFRKVPQWQAHDSNYSHSVPCLFICTTFSFPSSCFFRRHAGSRHWPWTVAWTVRVGWDGSSARRHARLRAANGSRRDGLRGGHDEDAL